MEWEVLRAEVAEMEKLEEDMCLPDEVAGGVCDFCASGTNWFLSFFSYVGISAMHSNQPVAR